ncbi:MAG TPA: hypothetical protein VFC03_13760 [Acidimicrobiales bacterium]|jgi:hypothetical protein|nr:hypothetical protein [Acidimicrobiales bacterium]
MTPERGAARAETRADSYNGAATTQVMKSTGTSSNYGVSQRQAARWAVEHKRRWDQPVGLATAQQVDAFRAEIADLKRLVTGERI